MHYSHQILLPSRVHKLPAIALLWMCYLLFLPLQHAHGGMGDITCWGDSLTQNGVAVALAKLYSGVREVHNQGVGGEPSTAIAVRQGGTPVYVTFPENSIPANGASDVQVITGNGDPKIRRAIKGTLQGIHGTLGRDIKTGNYIWTRTAPGEPVQIPPGTVMNVDTGDTPNHTVVLWYGRNNVGSNQTAEYVKGDLQRSVEHLKGSRFVILGITRSDNTPEYAGGAWANRINAVNAGIKEKWPDHYIDTMACLLAAHDPANAQDLVDVKNGVVPFSLRKAGDKTHLNPDGDMVLAKEIKKIIDANGW